MSSSEQSETFGTLTVQFRDGRKENVSGVLAKDALTIADHLRALWNSAGSGPAFAAILRPDSFYAVDLTQVRSMNFAPDEDEDEAEGAAQ